MAVEVRLPTVLRQFAGGRASIDAAGSTLGEVLADLGGRFPGMAEQISPSESGELPRFVNVYLNDEDVRYLDNLDTAVNEGDVISILPAVAGGAGPPAGA